LFYYRGSTALFGRHDFTRLEKPPFDQAVWDAMLAADHLRRPPIRRARWWSAPARNPPAWAFRGSRRWVTALRA
jgi:hypothetical protein